MKWMVVQISFATMIDKEGTIKVPTPIVLDWGLTWESAEKLREYYIERGRSVENTVVVQYKD